MHRLALRRVAIWAFAVGLVTILSAELVLLWLTTFLLSPEPLQSTIVASSRDIVYKRPAPQFYSAQEQPAQPEAILNPVVALAWGSPFALPDDLTIDKIRVARVVQQTYRVVYTTPCGFIPKGSVPAHLRRLSKYLQET
ncbi:MAG: hypothetical protein N2045_02325 [Fimbriimonadales bacterium]|jgi:hypothetical protein|nr:hypothetical protein [Fimbriimonadales bacterium]